MTSPQNDDVRIGIGYELDEASVSRTETALKGTDKSLVQIGAQAKASSREIGLFARAQANAAESSQDSAKAISDSVEALRDEEKAAKAAAEALEKRNEEAKQKAERERLEFADASGDKASIAGSTRGALDALTGGNSGALGQLLEGAEAVFDLGEAAGKVGGPIGNIVTKLGPGGLAGVAGVAGVALVAVTLAFKKFTDDANKQAEELSQVIDARINTAKFVSGGGTTDEAESRIADLRSEREAELSVLENLKASYAANVDGAGALSGVIKVLSPQEEELANRIKELEASTSGSATEIELLEGVLADGTIAANDAAAAEKVLAEARTASVLNEAAQAGELESLRLRAVDLTQEQIDAELKALETREASIQAEIASLEASGDTSEEVTAKIAALGEQLGFLGEQADVLKTARPAARSEAAEKAAEEAEREREKQQQESDRARERSAQDAQRKVDEARRAQEQYTQAVANARNAFADASADIKTGLIDGIADINQDLQDSLNEQSIEFNQSELAEERAYRRELAQISRDAKRSELDATRTRDFAAAAEAREQAAEAIADRKDDERAANAEQLTEFQQAQEALGREREIGIRDAQIDAQRQRRDAAIARDRSLRDAQAAYAAQSKQQNSFHNQALSAEQKFYDSRLKMMQQFTSSAGGGSRTSSTSTTTSSRTATSFEDTLRDVIGGR